jgi:hypothetical protein
MKEVRCPETPTLSCALQYDQNTLNEMGWACEGNTKLIKRHSLPDPE